MANFKKIDDLHDYNRQLMDDDWNDGQHFVFKLKNSMNNAGGKIDLATTLKVGHSQPGENHNIKLEQKSKGVSTDFGGMEMEIKATNDGKIKFTNEFSGVFKDVDGFENSAVTMEGTASAQNGLDWDAGFRHSGKDHHFKIQAKVNKDHPAFKTDVVWRPCEYFVIGERSSFNTTLQGTKTHLFHNTSFPGAKGLQAGGYLKGTHEGGINFKDILTGGYVNHTQGNNTAGAQVDFDYTTKSVKTLIGFQNKQDDHTWKFLAASSGVSRALLQWQLHRCCKANINTSIDLGDIPSGKISPFPWGFGFEVKY